MKRLAAMAFVALQRILPKYLMTAAIYHLTRIRTKGFKDWLINRFVSAYKVNLEEVLHEVPDQFENFNAFFIRELRAGCRPVDPADDAVSSPVDGVVSAAGMIEKNRMFQAKGLHYSLGDLLATDLGDAEQFIDGSFATLYLAPHNYHRVHSPLDAKLVAARYVPGDLFSVNESTVSLLPGLFARNERLVLMLDAGGVAMAVVFVGALHVGSINTPWTGEIRPRRKGVVEEIGIHETVESTTLVKGDLLGWFNMGSTVIILLPKGISDNFAGLVSGQEVRMGETIGRLQSGPHD